MTNDKDKPIKVLRIISDYVCGGVENISMNYYRNMDRSKYKIDFVFTECGYIPYEKELENNGDHLYMAPDYKKNIFKYIKYIYKLVKSNKYEIVHSHLNTISVFPLFAAWLAGAKIRIASNHSTSNPSEFMRNIVKLLLKPLAKLFATDYFACSKHAAIWLFGNKCYKKGEVELIKNAIDLSKFKKNETTRIEERKRMHINSNTFVLGHIGRFSKQKNHEFIIKVFLEILKIHPDSLLILVGQGELENKIRRICMNNSITDKVVFLKPRNDIYKVYQIFDAFLFPSLYEGLGNVVTECQAVQLECFVSENIPNEVIFTDYVHKLNLKENAQEWAKEIIIQCKTTDNKKNPFNLLVENGYEIQSASKKLENIYLDLVNREANK